jgi:RNA recognition motif-containing protein
MFSQFGKIIDVVALKTLRFRGQAWIVFADVAAATNAKNTMQGFPFFDKPIVSLSFEGGGRRETQWLGAFGISMPRAAAVQGPLALHAVMHMPPPATSQQQLSHWQDVYGNLTSPPVD